ncbi:hypothetical protein QUA03_14750 [Microcoleus sp. S36b_A4]
MEFPQENSNRNAQFLVRLSCKIVSVLRAQLIQHFYYKIMTSVTSCLKPINSLHTGIPRLYILLAIVKAEIGADPHRIGLPQGD